MKKFWQAINVKNGPRTFQSKEEAINYVKRHMAADSEYVITEATDSVTYEKTPVVVTPIVSEDPTTPELTPAEEFTNRMKAVWDEAPQESFVPKLLSEAF